MSNLLVVFCTQKEIRINPGFASIYSVIFPVPILDCIATDKIRRTQSDRQDIPIDWLDHKCWPNGTLNYLLQCEVMELLRAQFSLSLRRTCR